MNSLAKMRKIWFGDFFSSGRVVTLDVVRGAAIIFMTVYHQGLVYSLSGNSNTISYFFGYLSAPFFLIISGASLWLHENRHGWPLKMVIHGSLLFIFSWAIDIIAHRNFRVDWDIFQLIGSLYAAFGILNMAYLKRYKYVILTILICMWTIYPSIRPDEGVFAVWPYGIFFVVGYYYASFVNSFVNTPATSGLMLSSMFAYVVYWIFVQTLPYVISFEGILFSICICLLFSSLCLLMENNKMLDGSIYSLLIRYGSYPLTLYYCQQIVSRFCMKYQIYITISDYKDVDWVSQTSSLLLLMLIATCFFNRYRYLTVEWWLRKGEYMILSTFQGRNIPGSNGSIAPG